MKVKAGIGIGVTRSETFDEGTGRGLVISRFSIIFHGSAEINAIFSYRSVHTNYNVRFGGLFLQHFGIIVISNHNTHVGKGLRNQSAFLFIAYKSCVGVLGVFGVEGVKGITTNVTGSPSPRLI
jgi:hypothetical protein